jgi:TolB-like protein/Flp pilus assembly protein TadD
LKKGQWFGIYREYAYHLPNPGRLTPNVKLFEELKRRNVFRVGVAYAVAAWVLLQVFDVVGEILDLPEWGGKLILAMLVVGFFIALILAWAFELTPEGVKRESDVDRTQSQTSQTGRKIDRVIIALLALAVVFLLGDRFLSVERETEQPVAAAKDEIEVEASGLYDSIGVLPFVNITNDPEQDYFSDGIAEELLNALAKLKNLKVAARTSSFSLKGKNLDAIEIGDQLNVDTVLEGSVRKSGTRLRITAQLIDAANGYHLWSETYDRELTDVFAVQDEITGAIVAALKVHLETGEVVPSARHGSSSVEAYEKFLQGKYLLRSVDGDGRDALELFREATRIDPGLAAAWAARAQTVIDLRETAFWGDIPAEEAHLLARSNIDKALALDPGQAEAYVAQGMLYADEYRYEEALVSLEQAIAINPSLAEAWTWRGRLLYRFGRIKESKQSLLRAVELDPLYARTAFFAAGVAREFYDPEYMGDVIEMSREFPEISERLELFVKMLPLPESAEAYREVSASLGEFPFMQARYDLSVLKEFDEARWSEGTRYPQEVLMWFYIRSNQLEKAVAQYEKLSTERKQADINLEERSILLTMQGACEEAVDLLDRAHNGQIRIYGMVDPNMNRSNSQLALNRAYCLRKLGREAEAAEIIARVKVYVDTLRENAEWGYAKLETKLLILEGESEAALDVLEQATARYELDWQAQFGPIISTLRDHPRFVALYATIDRKIDSLREELGMPPATL